MIYFISDTHGGENMGKLKSFTPRDTENDLVIHLGDVGAFWDDSPENREFTDWLLSRDYKLAFVDGNHENFDVLLRFPEEQWNGGRVRRINKNIVQLMRGQIYSICGNTFFTMGGCRSSNHWRAEKPWWSAEEPSEEELALAYKNLTDAGLAVDYVLTHKYFLPSERSEKDANFPVKSLHSFIDEKVSFKMWYSGHWHDEYMIDKRHRVVFVNPVELG